MQLWYEMLQQDLSIFRSVMTSKTDLISLPEYPQNRTEWGAQEGKHANKSEKLY